MTQRHLIVSTGKVAGHSVSRTFSLPANLTGDEKAETLIWSAVLEAKKYAEKLADGLTWQTAVVEQYDDESGWFEDADFTAEARKQLEIKP